MDDVNVDVDVDDDDDDDGDGDGDGKYHHSFYLVMWLYERRCTTRRCLQLYFMFVPTEQR